MKIENISNKIIMEWDIVNWARSLPFWQKKTKLKLAGKFCLHQSRSLENTKKSGFDTSLEIKLMESL